jgi:mitochondrial fission protein ELM1
MSATDILVLLDDRAGNNHQSLGLAEKLGLPFTTRQVTYRNGVRIPNRVPLPLCLRAEPVQLDTPPRLIIATGRRLAPVMLALKRRFPLARTVQIMGPDLPPSRFDLVVLPAHDRPLWGTNILSVPLSLHRVSQATLQQASAPPFRPEMPRPVIACLVGGDTRAGAFTPAAARALGAQVSHLAASLWITTSRRTSPEAARALTDALTVPFHAYHWGDAGENPYMTYLSQADALVVTGDSASMLSEACFPGKPVWIADTGANVSEKMRRMHASVITNGLARRLEEATPDTVCMGITAAPTQRDSTELVVARIRAEWAIPNLP